MSPAFARHAPTGFRTYDLLLGYGYLQILDILTTLAFLAHGVAEANPVVEFVMVTAGSPLAGLAAVKAVAVVLGVFCQFTGRFRLMRRANLLFGLLIVWNLIALILSSAA